MGSEHECVQLQHILHRDELLRLSGIGQKLQYSKRLLGRTGVKTRSFLRF